jgi:uncharacterized protein (UPF0332 family)
MITPSDLMALAEHLATVPQEAAGRSAVSRAYYGAFHVVRSLFDSGCGIVLPGGPEVHKKLQFCLQNSGDADLVEISDRLQTLREQRNRADYQLADSKFASAADVRTQLDWAKAIVRDVEASSQRIDRYRTAIRNYANSVLKLPLKQPSR